MTYTDITHLPEAERHAIAAARVRSTLSNIDLAIVAETKGEPPIVIARYIQQALAANAASPVPALDQCLERALALAKEGFTAIYVLSSAAGFARQHQRQLR